MGQTFRAATVTDAIRQAKEELGPDALILEVRRSAFDGGVEIVAATGQTGEFPVTGNGRTGPLPRIDALAALRRRASRTGSAPNGTEGESDVGRSWGPDDLDVDFIRQYGVSERLASDLAMACGAGSALRRHAAVTHVLQRRISTEDLVGTGHERVVAALVGPSGVGKTTTIAKLAAIFSATRGRRVALVTTDTYRVGGIAQLKTFAEILQLPFYTVYTREDLDHALEETAEADLVLVDTPGCNPYDAAMLKEMRNLIASNTPVTCYLTLAMTGDFDELIAASQRFALLNPAGLIATKLDETRRAPAVIGLVEQTRLPLTYTCAGPLVPDDIAVASPAALADLLLSAMEYRYQRELVRQ